MSINLGSLFKLLKTPSVVIGSVIVSTVMVVTYYYLFDQKTVENDTKEVEKANTTLTTDKDEIPQINSDQQIIEEAMVDPAEKDKKCESETTIEPDTEQKTEINTNNDNVSDNDKPQEQETEIEPEQKTETVTKKEEIIDDGKVTLFDVFNEQNVKITMNEKTKMQSIEDTEYLRYTYEPGSHIIFCSKPISILPVIRIFVQRTPTQMYIGCVNKRDAALCDEYILKKRENQKMIIYGNYVSHGFSGMSNLAQGHFYGGDDSSFGYYTIKKYDNGIKAGDTVIMKYDVKGKELQFFKQEYSDYNTKRMKLMYTTNEMDKESDYHYCIGYRHDKSEGSRRFSYVVSIPTN